MENPTMKSLAVVLFIFILITQITIGQTIVSGEQHGSWIKNKSPYFLSDSTWVAKGNTLTIEPGVEIIAGPNVTLDIFGSIETSNDPTRPTVFRTNIDEYKWNGIKISYSSSSLVHQITNSIITNAKKGITLLNKGAHSGVHKVLIKNILIKKCDYAIFADCYGDLIWNQSNRPRIDATIENTIFISNTVAAYFYAHGSSGFSAATSWGFIEPLFHNNIFKDSNTAIEFDTGYEPGATTPECINNVFDDCIVAIKTEAPYNVKIFNNVFSNCNRGVERDGQLSKVVYSNCFANCGRNFINYPNSYGQLINKNRNGALCDIAFNIFQDPAFINNIEYKLSPSSPCIDAGHDSIAFRNICLPPSFGTTANDIGAYGGPKACEWNNPITVVDDKIESKNVNISFELGANYPNPFNPTTTIKYQLPQNSHVQLIVVNSLGQVIQTLVDSPITAGYHAALWNGQDHDGNQVSSGLYFYILTTNSFSQTRKMLLVR